MIVNIEISDNHVLCSQFVLCDLWFDAFTVLSRKTKRLDENKKNFITLSIEFLDITSNTNRIMLFDLKVDMGTSYIKKLISSMYIVASSLAILFIVGSIFPSV